MGLNKWSALTWTRRAALEGPGAFSRRARERAKDFRGRRISKAGEEHPGPVVVDHRRCPLAIASSDLGDVLEAGHQGNPMARTGSRHHVELRQRGDGRRFIENHEQGSAQSTTLCSSEREGRRQDLCGDRREHRPVATLIVSRSGQEQRP